MSWLYRRTVSYVGRKFKIDAHYFLSGGFWLTVLQIITLVGGLVTSVLFSNLLDPSDYGIYKYLIGLGVLLSTFTITGITQSIQQTAIKDYDGFFSFAMRKSAIFSIAIVLSALSISTYYFLKDDMTLGIGCIIIAVFVPLTNIFQNISYYLLGKKRFKEVTIFQGFDTAISTLILICVLFLTKNILILFFVFLFLQSAGNIIQHFFYKPKKELLLQTIKKQYYSYALHTTIRDIIFNTVYKLDNIIVFTHLGATDLAIYSIANLIPEQIKGTFKNLSSLLLIRYAKHDDLSQIQKSLWGRTFQLFLILSCLTLVYWFISPLIYHLLFPRYESAIIYSQLAALSFPSFVVLIPSSALQAQLKERELHLINFTNAFVLLISLIFFTYSFGLIGAIGARILYRYFNLLISYLLIFNKK